MVHSQCIILPLKSLSFSFFAPASLGPPLQAGVCLVKGNLSPGWAAQLAGASSRNPKGFRVQFPVRAQSEVVGLIPLGLTGETLIHVARVGVSLSLSLCL